MMARFKLYLFIISLSFLSQASFAQEIKVRGGFLKDSVQIGEPVGYYLSAAYPQSLTVLFPDSTFTFTPFEYNSKRITPTSTANGISRDSIVYYLSTFEVDKVQILSLPVFVTSAKDCTAYESVGDSVYLIELVKALPPDTLQAQNLPLKANTLYEKVFTQFNYIILGIIIGILIIAAIVVWIVFGKRIIKYFKMKNLQKSHLKFIESFTSQFQQLNALFSPEKTESTVSIWKKYLEQLEQRPYTKLTSRETVALESHQKLDISLKRIDRAIYGNQTSVIEPLEELKQFAEERFQKKLEQIKNG